MMTTTPLLPLTLVVAIARNGAIGRAGGLPWDRASEDMRWFKHVTVGHTVVMGRKTWDSLPDAVRPLPDRVNVVVTRDERNVQHPGAVTVMSLEKALQVARLLDSDPCVIGGAEVYRQALPFATRVFLTEVDVVPADADAFLDLDRSAFREVSRVRGIDPRLTFVTLER